jgi:hypothetical protein
MFLSLHFIILVTLILRVVGRHLYDISIPNEDGIGISNDNMKYCCFMHNQ